MFFKKVRYIKFCVLFGISSQVQGSDLSKYPFNNVFDSGVYDQRILKADFYEQGPESVNDKKLNENIIGLLLSKKLEYIENKIFKECDRELQDIKLLMEKYKPSNAQKALKLLGGVLSTAGGFALFPLLPEVASARAVFAVTSALTTIGALSSGLQDFVQPNGQLDLDKLKSSIEGKKKDLILKINQEPIFDLEVQYVIRKRFYPKELQSEIENTLIMARTDSFPPLDFKREFLSNCLKLPIQKKSINLEFKWWDLSSDLDLTGLTVEQKNARKILTSYHPETKKQFEEIILKMVASPQLKKPFSGRFFYLHGLPGLGKTTATRAITDYLGLPSFEVTIRTQEDISKRSLEGADWKKEFGNPGHISDALMKGHMTGKKDKYEKFKIPLSRLSKYQVSPEVEVQFQTEKKVESYKNTVLIINDFDRLALGEDSPIEPLSFLLDYLDSEKKEMLSPYFKSKLEIKDLIIFITGNSPIPTSEKFDALRDRVIEINFREFELSSKKNILSNYFDETSKMFGLRMDRQKLAVVGKQDQTISLRKAKQNIENDIIKEIISNKSIPINKILINKRDVDIKEMIKNDKKFKKKGVKTIQMEEKSLPESIAYPPYFKNSKIVSRVKTLEKIRDAVVLMISDDQADQLQGIRDLLGRSWNSGGYIENLWKCDNKFSKGTDNDLNALRSRMNRFEEPDYKMDILQFHIQLIQSIVDAMLRKFEENGFIHQKIWNNEYRKENIEIFLTHLLLLTGFNDQDDLAKHEKTPEIKSIIENYKKWLGKENEKIQKLEKLYLFQ